jgi:hypothetical protein
MTASRQTIGAFLPAFTAAAVLFLAAPVAAQPPAKGKGAPPAKAAPQAKADAKAAENPYRAAKVGDWASYTMSTGATTMTMKQTVTAKTADEVTLRTEQKFGDMAMPASEQKIKLKETFDPAQPSQNDQVKSEVIKLGAGKETLTIAGKKYECEWSRTKVVSTTKTQPPITTTMVMKTWTSKDVPLGGLVKSETEVNGMTTVMELTGSGRGK